MRFRHVTTFLLWPLAACTSLAPTRPGEPAVLSHPSKATTEKLSQAVSQMLGGRDVLLAPDVLTSSPELILDPRPQRSLATPAGIMGRSQARPDHFALSKTGRHCILTHKESGKSMSLKGVACEAVSE